MPFIKLIRTETPRIKLRFSSEGKANRINQFL